MVTSVHRRRSGPTCKVGIQAQRQSGGTMGTEAQCRTVGLIGLAGAHRGTTGTQVPRRPRPHRGGAPWGHPETPSGAYRGTPTHAQKGHRAQTHNHRDMQPQRHTATETHSHRDAGTQGHRGTGGHRDTEAQRHRDTETQRHRDRHRQWEGGGQCLCAMPT